MKKVRKSRKNTKRMRGGGNCTHKKSRRNTQSGGFPSEFLTYPSLVGFGIALGYLLKHITQKEGVGGIGTFDETPDADSSRATPDADSSRATDKLIPATRKLDKTMGDAWKSVYSYDNSDDVMKYRTMSLTPEESMDYEKEGVQVGTVKHRQTIIENYQDKLDKAMKEWAEAYSSNLTMQCANGLDPHEVKKIFMAEAKRPWMDRRLG